MLRPEEAAALAALSERLEAEAACAVCLEPAAEPLLTPCGHGFCAACVAALPRAAPAAAAACPQCRGPLPPGSCRPNRPLRDVAEAAAEVARLAAAAARRPRCAAHGEPPRLFCERCRRPLCALCHQEPAHRGHPALPAEQAAPRLREMLQSDLVFFQKEKEEFKPEGEKKSEELMGTVASEKEKLQAGFRELQQFLREQESVLLAQLDELHGALAARRSEYVSSVAARRLLLDTLVVEIEKKRDQPDIEFLMDIDSTLNSCEAAKAPIPELVSSELQRRVCSFFETGKLVMNAMAEFKADLLNKMDRERVKVTLDPETASPYLILSKDGKTLRLGEGQQNLPDTPKRFTGSPSVLGSQGFTAGRHYWELEVGDGDSWAVGVAVESVRRKDSLILAMGGIWALRLGWDRQYTALTMPPTPLVLEEEPRRIRVHLDYEAGEVTFYNVENMTQIFQFKASFTEKVFPYFWLWSAGSYIQLCA
ncbi:E3 ubiquitin-protein ligase TRIM7-like [Rhea pennata]|uniref:E3 ubiquitin-protein ligase TRIM7-like n=1 Tax=Rhea pennata TaxID=8795 RepID=UPI002E26A909